MKTTKKDYLNLVLELSKLHYDLQEPDKGMPTTLILIQAIRYNSRILRKSEEETCDMDSTLYDITENLVTVLLELINLPVNQQDGDPGCEIVGDFINIFT